ncbi:MAG: ankyrin repeat domain-containing protein [Verrucomicrobia bacterium]|nr:ankyrin repeat domain-containing protein [Verrucomicrobiota bacterium]
MNRFNRKRSRWLRIVGALVAVPGIVAFLTLSGWFVDPSVALRELERRGVAPTVESVFAAAQSGDAELLGILVRAGVSTSQQNASGDAPLHIAAGAKQWVALNVLAEHGPELDALNARGQVALELAFQHGGHEAADRMLAKGASSQASFSGMPPLIALIKANDYEGIRILLKHHADPDIATDRGETPLFLAAQSGNLELVLALVEAGADPNAITTGGLPIVSYLIQRTNQAGLKEEQVVKALGLFIAKGVDLERPDSEGWRPIHHAMAAKLSSVTASLLPLVKNVDGTLWIALKNQDYTGVRTLLEMGASVHERNENGDTALIGMIRQNQPQIVQMLLEFGADPTQLAPEGQAAIPLSIVMGHDEVTIALIHHESAPPPDNYLITPATLEFRKLFKNALLDFYVRKESIKQVTAFDRCNLP